MDLILFKSYLNRGIISIRGKFCITIKNYRYSHKNCVTRMRCQKRFNILEFQNIILSVADSGVIGRITLKSVIIYESNMNDNINLSRSRLDVCEIRHLENVETTWVSGKIYQIFCCFNSKTSVQITFLANLTGILGFLTYDHHVPCKKWCFIFWKIPYFRKKLSFLAQWKQYACRSDCRV